MASPPSSHHWFWEAGRLDPYDRWSPWDSERFNDLTWLGRNRIRAFTWAYLAGILTLHCASVSLNSHPAPDPSKHLDVDCLFSLPPLNPSEDGSPFSTPFLFLCLVDLRTFIRSHTFMGKSSIILLIKMLKVKKQEKESKQSL